ncbi:hypothetical protein A3Q56_07918 [Intoshia linei]|uniref:Uncharacterized protein n=1 Tax=Intoshia linei TaxID=1819745 RepID=A0A177AQV0_9BILA|nr:hypothetical protein A3Q56_07918 [Intoshia linei]
MRHQGAESICRNYSRMSSSSHASIINADITEIGRDLFNIFPWHGTEKEFPHSALIFREAREILSSLTRTQQVVVSS